MMYDHVARKTAENSENTLHFKIYENKKQLCYIAIILIIKFHCILDQINTVLVSIRDFFSKHEKSY